MNTAEKDKLNKDAASDERRALEAAKNGEFMNASFHVTSALQKYTRLNNNKKIQKLKALQVEYNQKAEPLQSHEISIPLDDNMRAELDRLINSFTSKPTLEENLIRMAKSAVLVPRLKEAEKNAQNIRPVTAQLVTHMLVDDDGHTLSYDDFETTWLHEHYGIAFNFSRDIINTITSGLIDSGQYTHEAIMNIIVEKRLFNTVQLLKIDAALERRFADDYFSSIHILTPLIENLFMFISRNVGLDTITFGGKQTSTRDKTLSSNILLSKEYGQAWGTDFCYMLNFFMYEPMAARYRHKIAHGDIKMSECNFSTFNILFYFLIKITLMVEVHETKVPQDQTI
ncbi:hypothetical protein JNM87_01900 [Candidatus Saccharibacteria bacterium]|nr:hypothetical protein [Candidatus Saccharibacteria bacterium]